MAEKRAILANPIANLDSAGRLVKLHCPTPGENCQLDQAKDKRTVTWASAWELVRWRITGERPDARIVPGQLCVFCFGGEGE